MAKDWERETALGMWYTDGEGGRVRIKSCMGWGYGAAEFYVMMWEGL